MATEQEINAVISSMFLRDDRQSVSLWSAPTYEDLRKFAELVADKTSEERFQVFFENHPSLISGAVHYGTDDSFLGLISKPRIGDYFADFATFVVSQGGARITLIELEKPHSVLFTRDGKLTADLRSADSQITNWRNHIRKDEKAFVREKIDQLCKAPLYTVDHGGSFRTRSEDSIRSSWQAFGGFEYESIGYLVVCGRWSDLSHIDRKRFIAMSTDEKRLYNLRAYEQLGRDAFTNAYVDPTF